VLSESSTTTSYINVPAQQRKIFSFRGGITQYQTPIAYRDLKGVRISEIIDVPLATDNKFDVRLTTLSTVMVTAGMSMQGINNIQILANGRKKRSNERWLSSYFDVLFAPVISVPYANSNTDWKKRVGWRFGYLADFHSYKRVTFGGRAEIGSRPGIVRNGFYLRCGLGMTINLM
jgi:hypothetical protein